MAPAPRSPRDVELFLAELDHPLKPAIERLRAIVLGAAPGIGEEIKWNAPSFRTPREHFATFHLRARDRVQLVLHLGARGQAEAGFREAIPDPGGLLEWRGRDRAIASFATLADVEARKDALVAIVRAWAEFV